jgi:GntR family transcriptional regulator, transcriptional repressor for pyruvate dehydrogenase complex
MTLYLICSNQCAIQATRGSAAFGRPSNRAVEKGNTSFVAGGRKSGEISAVGIAGQGTRERSAITVKKGKIISLALGPALNRTQELTQRLAAEILSGRLKPGARLPTEQELSLATGVSRTVVREAVAALRADGLVITRQGLGAFVPADVQRRPFRIDPDEVKSANDVLQILELRMGLEIEASGLAAERRTGDDLLQIEAALRSVEAEIEAGGNAVDADFAFHLAIFRSVHNRFFPQLLEFLGKFIIPRQIVNAGSGGDPERVRYLKKIQTEHVAIYEAIRDANNVAARRAARRHLSNSLRRYQEISSRVSSRAEAARLRRPNDTRSRPDF